VLGCIIVLTGPVDYVSDGTSVILLKNGHEILGKITGSGCILGSCIASYCAAAASLSQRHDGQLVSGDMLLCAVAG
jgi:thiamine-phosphate diphosphorylase/hydroxyethylthiazole kinase